MRDAEFRLLVDACRVGFTDCPIGEIPAGIDWTQFVQLARRHRVQGLCWNALAPLSDRLPDEAASALQADARAITLENLRMAAECGRLLSHFEAALIPLMFVKGLTLGALAYAKPYSKMSMDIDLLVEPGRLLDAQQVLRVAGYGVTIPCGVGAPGLVRWHRRAKESVWYRAEGGFQIDLHTRLADHPETLAGVTACSRSRPVSVATGITLPTLDGDELFAYLCVHGASSAWFRLKWITDLAGLLHGAEAAELERLYGRSRELGAGRAAGQALLLAANIFSVNIGQGLRDRLARDTITRWLARVAERELRTGAEPTERLFGTAAIHLTQLGLHPGWRFKASEAARQLRAITANSPPQ